MKAFIISAILILLCPTVTNAEITYFTTPDGEEHYTDKMEAVDGEPDPDVDWDQYTEEEQEEMSQLVSEINEEIEQERGELPTGYVTVSLTQPASWEESNITILLHNKTYKEIDETLILRQELDWEDSFEIPIGEYTFWRADTDAGDSFQCDLNTFEVTEDEGVSIVLYNGSQESVDSSADSSSVNNSGFATTQDEPEQSSNNSDNIDTSESVTTDEEISNNASTEYIYYDNIVENNSEENNFTRRIVILVIILCAAVAFVIASLFRNRKKRAGKDMVNNEGFGEYTEEEFKYEDNENSNAQDEEYD